MPKLGLWSGREPPLGLTTLRDPRLTPGRHAQVLDDANLNNIASEKRLGWIKKHHTSLGSSCRMGDGLTFYAAADHVSADLMQQIWVREISINFPDFLPVGDATILARRNNIDQHFWLYFEASSGKIVLKFDTAAEFVTLTSATAITAGTRFMVTCRRDGDNVEMFFDGVSVGTHVMTTGSGEDNKDVGNRWIYYARPNNATGDEPDDQFARVIIGEDRDWSVNRTDTQILDNSGGELDPSATHTGLRHYRRFHAKRNRRIIYDSDEHGIAIATRRYAWTRPCGPTAVDRHYPERCASWNEANPGIERGEEWYRYDGVGVGGTGQDHSYTVPTKGEDLINRLEGGIATWAGRIEFIAERTGVLECLADWALSAASDDPALRIEKTAGDKFQVTTRIGGVNRVITGTVNLVDCRPYVVDFIRRDTDWRAIIYQKDTDDILEEVAIVVPAGVGNTVSGGPLTLGKQRDGSNAFQGAIGNFHMFRDGIGPRSTPRVSAQMLSKAVIAIPAKRIGRLVVDLASDVVLVPDCVSADADIPDGPFPADCSAAGTVFSRGHFKGLYDYKRTSSDYATTGVERTLIAVFGGAIYEAPQTYDGSDLAFSVERRGISEGRTLLSDWAQLKDELIHVNGVDPNLIRDRSGRWTKQGIEASTTAPTVVGATGGNLIPGATYSWFIVFRDPVTGHRSNPGLIATVTLTSTENRGSLTNIPVSIDPDRPNMEREIYRTQWGIGGQGADFYRTGTLTDNADTTFDDDLADTALFAPLRIETDEFGFFIGGVPPVSRYAAMAWARIFMAGDPENPTRLTWSRTGNPQAFSPAYFVDLADEGTGSPITALWKVYDRLFIGTEKDIWELKATGRFGTFRIDRVVNNIGPSGQWSVTVYQGSSYFWNAGEKKLYKWAGQGEPLYISWGIEPTVNAFNADAMKYSSGVPYVQRNQIYLTASTGTTDDTKEGDEGIPENDKVLVYDVAREAFTVHSMDVNILRVVEDPKTQRNRICAGDYMGFVRLLDEGFNDGYDQAGTRRGLVHLGPTTTELVLNTTLGVGFPASLPIVEDGLIGCPFFLIRKDANGLNRVVAKGRIQSNTMVKVFLQAPLSVAPILNDTWCIGGIHFKHRTADLDFGRNIDATMLLEGTILHRLETGDVELGENTLIMQFFQDGETQARPLGRYVLDLTDGTPDGNPVKRCEVWESGVFHTIELESFLPDQPCKIEAMNLRYEDSDYPVEAV